MNRWVIAEALDHISDFSVDNEDWDFYWKVRRLAEETYNCKFNTKNYGLDNMFIFHTLTAEGTLK